MLGMGWCMNNFLMTVVVMATLILSAVVIAVIGVLPLWALISVVDAIQGVAQ